MEAFSDGVLAIVITIMVLELHEPKGESWHDFAHVVPTLATYLLSFTYVGIYWNNHHHMIAATKRVDGTVLWANLHLLFWLSLIPWTTSWLGATDFARVPTAVYGISLLAAAVAYFLLQTMIIRLQGADSILASAVGKDWKGKFSPVLCVAGIVFALADLPMVSMALYISVALLWFIPDRRLDPGSPRPRTDRGGWSDRPAGQGDQRDPVRRCARHTALPSASVTAGIRSSVSSRQKRHNSVVWFDGSGLRAAGARWAADRAVGRVPAPAEPCVNRSSKAVTSPSSPATTRRKVSREPSPRSTSATAAGLRPIFLARSRGAGFPARESSSSSSPTRVAVESAPSSLLMPAA
jgi:uncharacterized membrane protein